MKNFHPVFTLEQVTVDYVDSNSPRSALNNLSLTIDRGAWVSIAGRNGGGKSTLVKVLAGLLPVSSGMFHRSPEAAVHLVMQNPETQLLGETIYEELYLSMRQQPDTTDLEDELWQLLDRVGMHVPLHQPIRSLSGGQKQLLNMAGCLAGGADVIVFDEVTSMLDPDSRRTVLEAAAALHRSGHTVVWVTHRMEELAGADRIVVLDEGAVVFDGTPGRFFYGQAESSTSLSHCELLGFEPPYVVQVSAALREMGHKLDSQPLSPQLLCQAVSRLCLSK
jgi:energy-coupling factor transport system ATP-binding protein